MNIEELNRKQTKLSNDMTILLNQYEDLLKDCCYCINLTLEPKELNIHNVGMYDVKIVTELH